MRIFRLYKHGTIEHISRLRLEYESTDSEQRRSAIRNIILTQVSTVDLSDAPQDLKAFINNLK